MKRITILVLVLSLFALGNSFADQPNGWAIGGAFAFNWAPSVYSTGAALCLKFPGLPIMFGFSANLAEPLVIGITADWWLFRTALVGPVALYIGPGLFLGVNTAGGSPVFGIRIPIGFQIFIVPAFEIFLEPAVAIELIPTLPDFGIQAALGFRFWF